MTAVRIRDAAAALGRSESTLRRWLAAGAPRERPGEAGRGKGALVEIEALQAWRNAGPAPDCKAFLDRLECVLVDYLRSGDHKLIGVRDEHARVYLAALAEYVRGRFEPD